MPEIDWTDLPPVEGTTEPREIDFEGLPPVREAEPDSTRTKVALTEEQLGIFPEGLPEESDIEERAVFPAEWLRVNGKAIDEETLQTARIDQQTMEALTGQKMPLYEMYESRPILDEAIEDDWRTIAKKSLASAPLSFAKSASGLVFQATELAAPDTPVTKALKEIGAYDEPPLITMSKEAINHWDKRLREQEIHAGDSKIKRYGGLIMQQTAQNLPLLGVGWIARSPGLATNLMGVYAQALKYIDLRESGIPKEAALGISGIVGLGEKWTEQIPTEMILASGQRYVNKILTVPLAEVPGELIATSIEVATDKVSLRPEMSFEEYVSELGETAIVALGTAGLLTTATHPLTLMRDSAKEDAEKKDKFLKAKNDALESGLGENEAILSGLEAVATTTEEKANVQALRELSPEELQPPPAPAIPTEEEIFERITREDLTEEELGEMLDLFARGEEFVAEPVADIEQRLLDAGMSEVEAKTNAAITVGITNLARRAGLPVEEVVARYLPEVTREEAIDTEDLAEMDALEQAAYHGTPHKFDKFTLDHIGTGEGAQAYGWGLYFAESKDVAQWYREITAGDIGRQMKRHPELFKKYSDIVVPIKSFIDLRKSFSEGKQAALKQWRELDARPEFNYKDKIALLEELTEKEWNLMKDKGQLLKVELAPKEDEWLDWDKPLSEQSEKVQETLAKRYEWLNPEDIDYDASELGQSIYRRIASQFKTFKEASLDLREAGIPGIKYLDAVSRGKEKGTSNFVLFDEELVKIEEFLQGDVVAPRGRIRFTPEGINIELLKDADASTFVHEMGHLYFRMMSDLAGVETVSEELKSDFNTVREWLGAEEGADITVEQQEQFARGFEAYLREGKAPTSALAEAFENFKQWLMEIYRSLRDLNVELTDDVRGVMDRLLADEGVEVEEREKIITITRGEDTTVFGKDDEGITFNQDNKSKFRICDFKGSCDRVRRTPKGEQLWQEMMKTKEEVSEAEFLANVNIDDILDEDETFEDLKALAEGQEDPLKLFKANNGQLYFLQMAGFEYIWERADLPRVPLEEAVLEQAPIPAVEEGLKPTFKVTDVATERLPETTTGLLPSKADKGTYYMANATELQDYLDRHGDGFLYRVTHVRSIDKGFDKGNPEYRHRFKDNKPRKTIALTTSLDNAKKHLDNIDIDDHTIIYRVQPQDLAEEFAIQIPSDRVGEVVHVHSPQPTSTTVADVIFRRQEFLEEVTTDVSKRGIEERRTARIERRAEEVPTPERLRPGARRGRGEVFEQKAPPKEIKNIRQLAKSLGGIDFNREHLKGELNKLKEDVPATRLIINKKNQGVTLDRLLESAIEAGILSEVATIDDLLVALEKNLQTPEAIEAEIAKEEKVRRKAEAKEFELSELKKEFVELSVKLRTAYREGKIAGAAKEAQKAKRILARARKIRLVRDYFNLTDAELKSISRKNPLLMSQYEFKLYLDKVRLKAVTLSEKSFEKAKLMKTIHEKDLGNVDNYRRVLGLPPITKMTTEQLKKFDEALQPFHEGDVFLSERELETVDRTDLEGIKTWREAKEALSKETGVPISELEKIKVSEWDEYKWDTALAESNPFYKMLVTETSRKMIEANMRTHEIENELFELARKSEKSRGRTFVEKAIPKDEQIFNYIESAPEERTVLAEDMTPEQLDLAHYIQSYFQEALEYLIKTKSLQKGRENYFVHMRQTFLEAVTDKGLLGAFRGLFRQYQEDEMVFNILDEDTGNILPLEKFFQFSLRRTGGLDPTRNVIRAFLTYAQTLEKKKSLDELIPKMDIYAQSITPQILTPRGLEADRSIKKFVNKYINNRKGRRIRWVAKQGGKIDVSIRGLKTFTTLLDLGLNIPTGLAAFVGETAANFTVLGAKRHAKGVARSKTKQGKAILKKYEAFTGRSAWEEFTLPGKQLNERMADGMFGLFHQATVEANRHFLLGMMTEAEFNAGEITSERLAQLNIEMGRFRVVPGARSLVGSTSAGSALMQYKSWAAPVLRTNLKNINTLLKDIVKKPTGEALTSKEAHEIYRVIGQLSVVAIVGAYAMSDDDDESFTGQILKKLYRESMTLLQGMDPEVWLGVPRMYTFLSDLSKNIGAIVRMEEYKTKPGLKGVTGLQRQLTPRVIKQVLPEKKKKEIKL